MTRILGGLTMHEIARHGNVGWRPRSTVAFSAVLIAALVGGRAVQAQGEVASPRAALTLEAPEDCATRDAIAAGVRARSSRIELVDGAALVLHVALARSLRSVAAELRVVWPDGRRSQRSLSAPTCAEAADAMALLIALTLDPSSSVAQPQDAPAAQPEAAAIGSADPSGAAVEPAPASAPEARPAEASQVPPAEDAADATDATDGADPGTNPFAFDHVALGLAFQGALGIAPRIMPGAAVTAHVAGQGRGPWTPLLQLRVGRSWLTADRASGRALFELDAVHMALCPLGARGASLAARVCAAGALGSLRARGSETYDPKSHDRLWLSAGAELLLTAELLGPLQLQASAGVAAPFFRHRFAFAPSVFHRVAGLTGHGYVALALRF